MSDGYKNRVLKLDLEGNVLGSYGEEGRAPGRFAFAHHLTLGKKGELYVAEIQNWRVSKFLFDQLGRALRFESSGEVRTANRLPSSTPPTHAHSRLWLLPSGPDQVHGRPLWRTPRSTPSHGTE